MPSSSLPTVKLRTSLMPPPAPDELRSTARRLLPLSISPHRPAPSAARLAARSEEHTSELQSLMRISYAVFCLKKTNTHTNTLFTILLRIPTTHTRFTQQ